MIITEQVVKTTSTIQFNFEEFKQIAKDYQNGTKRHHYPRAFVDININELLKETDTARGFAYLSLDGNGDTCQLIAESFGFEGWVNAGYYDPKKDIYRMQVFNYGDRLNTER